MNILVVSTWFLALSFLIQDEIEKMAEYSADLYAKNPLEKANYVVYYRYSTGS